MRILFLTTHFNSGGITRYILTLGKGLVDHGHQVSVVSCGGDCVDQCRDAGIVHHTFNICTKSELNPKIYLALIRLGQLIKKEKIDVIHANTRVTQVMAACVSRLTRVPYVSTGHGYFRPHFFRRSIPCWGKRVIAISSAVVEHLENDFGVPAHRITLVPTGVEFDRFALVTQQMREQTRQLLGINKRQVIGIIARLSEEKGHDTLIKAHQKILKRFPDALLIIVGEGRCERRLKQLVQDLNLDGAVQFYPQVNQTAKFLPIFDVFVLPSIKEGLGLSALEAQAAGLPVIASRVGGLVNLIEDGKTGLLVEPGDDALLAQSISFCLGNPLEANAMGLRAREFVQKNFSVQQMVEKVVKVYEEVNGKL